MSELTTAMLVLAGWWALLSWRETRRLHWLLLLACCVGWGAITRPLTMLAFALPIGVLVIADVVRLGQWRHLGLAIAAGLLILSILPLWSARTTGSWRTAPVEKYRLDYLPFDKIGFRADTTPPRRRAAMSRVLEETYREYFDIRARQSLDALPVTLGQRAAALLDGFFGGARLPLLLLAIFGLVRAAPGMRFAAVSAALVVLAHLPYAHWEAWTVYYLEGAPVAAALVGVGAWELGRRLGEARATLALTGLAVFVAIGGAVTAAQTRAERLGSRMYVLERQIRDIIPRLPSPGILFVRYSPRISPNPALVRNSAHLEREPMWIVHDLGPRDEELRRLAPGRATHSLDIDRLVRSR
jgi:hypothetical protein